MTHARNQPTHDQGDPMHGLRRPVIAAAAAVGALLATMSAQAQTAEHTFRAAPASTAEYELRTDPDIEELVPVGGEEHVAVSVWLPHARPGGPEPGRVPVVLTATPYAVHAGDKVEEKGQLLARSRFVPYGYAFAIGSVYGTGNSDGCWQHGGPREVEATLAMIEFLATAPWSNGNVGMRGSSYSGTTAVAAATADDPRARHLKAIIPLAGLTGMYDGSVVADGVPSALNGPGIQPTYLGLSHVPGPQPGQVQVSDRPACAPDNAVASADVSISGDHGPYWVARDYRLGVDRVPAAVLWVHGFADVTVQPAVTVGFWERLPKHTPHKLILGQWGHGEAFSGSSGREDAEDIELAWFDRWLKGLETGVESWPDVQVQEVSGSWRAERDWPAIDGRPGHLELAPGGVTTFSEVAPGPQPATQATVPERPALPTDATFLVEARDRPLHLSGMPVLDLWVEVDQPDAHLVAVLDVLGPDGSRTPAPPLYGARSLRHLDAMTDDYFHQESGSPVARNTAVPVPIRLQPTDLVVPVGHRLRIRLSGAGPNDPPAVPSGAAATVRVLHDCDHKSVLRFVLPDVHAERFQVAERAASPAAESAAGEDGGMARKPLCGRAPIDPLDVTRGQK